MRRAFRTFIGVDLGGGKGKTTAIARLCLGAQEGAPPEVIVEDLGAPGPWYDEQLLEYLLRYADSAVVAIDAPLTLTACVRCTLPSCPGVNLCEVNSVVWFRKRAAAQRGTQLVDLRTKPRYTPYTQRATEVVLHEDLGITPRETLGQGMGPLTARMAYLRHALSAAYHLNQNLLEVYPKATLTQLFPDGASAPQNGAGGVRYKDSNGQAVKLDGISGRPQSSGSQVARLYKRSGHALPIRARVLSELPGLRFAPGQWREFAVQSDHQFDALISAYTAFLWAQEGWELPAEPMFAEDGWIWCPPAASIAKSR